MLSSYIDTNHHIVSSVSRTKRIIECISDAGPKQSLPWLDDNVILFFSGYTIMTQSLVKNCRLANKIHVVDSQITKGLINSYDKISNVADRANRSTEDLRQIYREYEVVIQPILLDDHWFLVVYSDNTFRVYDSLRNGISEIVMSDLDTAIFGPNSMKKREFASPLAFQQSYWECGYFVCSIIKDILCRYRGDTSQTNYPADTDVKRYTEQSHCHTIAKEILQAYNKYQSFVSY